MDAAAILRQNHRTLFPGDETAIKRAYRALVKVWHPDHNTDPKAKDVFAHIANQHDAALKRGVAPSTLFTRENGTQFRMEYLRHTIGEGCEIFVGQSSVAYLIGHANSDLADRASARKWKFSGPDMKREMERFLPTLVREERLQGGRLFIFRRTPDQILMRDLLDLTPGRIEPVHVSWMVTRLTNIACYLEWAGLAHLSLAPEFLLVDLKNHGVALCGPTLYSTEFGKRPKAAPARTILVDPSLRQKSTMASGITDRLLIRHTGLELLGDPSGNRIRVDPDVRPDVAKWLSSAPSKTAIEDYTAWEASLGTRKFIVYPKTAEEILSSAAN